MFTIWCVAFVNSNSMSIVSNESVRVNLAPIFCNYLLLNGRRHVGSDSVSNHEFYFHQVRHSLQCVIDEPRIRRGPARGLFFDFTNTVAANVSVGA